MTISSTAKNPPNISQRTQELGIEELVRNVVHQGGDSKKDAEAVWEGCKLIFDAKPQADAQMQTAQGFFSSIASMIPINTLMDGSPAKPDQKFGTSIIMPDGTFLYHATLNGLQVNAFREGPWVERLTAYSKQLTEQRLQHKHDEEQKRLDEKRKPFQNIDF